MKMALTVVTLTLLSLLLVILGMSYPWSLDGGVSTVEVEQVETREFVESEEDPAVIKIMTWNLGFLYGDGSEGPGYAPQSEEFFLSRLQEVVAQIKEWNPDVICFQEIDFDAHRSRGIDQAEYLAREAGYPYLARAVSWKANYIPFPYWPLSRHFGSMQSGGAILSKYPLVSHRVHLLKKPSSQPWWYNLFYLHRYFQEVIVRPGQKSFKLVNVHLEAFDRQNREAQVELLLKKIEQEDVDIVAGDFNTIPKSATKRTGFGPDEDYEYDMSYELMLKSEMLEVIPDEIYVQNEEAYFTFPALRADRRLDYIFYRRELKMMKAEVLSSALSDHLPLKASFQIDSPKFNPFSL